MEVWNHLNIFEQRHGENRDHNEDLHIGSIANINQHMKNKHFGKLYSFIAKPKLQSILSPILFANFVGICKPTLMEQDKKNWNNGNLFWYFLLTGSPVILPFLSFYSDSHAGFFSVRHAMRYFFHNRVGPSH